MSERVRAPRDRFCIRRKERAVIGQRFECLLQSGNLRGIVCIRIGLLCRSECRIPEARLCRGKCRPRRLITGGVVVRDKAVLPDRFVIAAGLLCFLRRGIGLKADSICAAVCRACSACPVSVSSPSDCSARIAAVVSSYEAEPAR